jgi:hypothetical protein
LPEQETTQAVRLDGTMNAFTEIEASNLEVLAIVLTVNL